LETKPISNSHALLRRESFGGTLFFVAKGVRTYVTHEEFDAIAVMGSLPGALVKELGISAETIIVQEPSRLFSHNFSAPDTVFLEVTRACNLRCAHCFNSSGSIVPNQMTQTELELIIDDLAVSGAQEIRFTGGEPMMYPGIITLIRRAFDLGLRCSMGTNAALITDRTADALKNAGLRAGIISLDGLAEQHDRVRGHDSFRRACEGLEFLRAREIDVRVNIVVMQSNLEDIPHLVDILVKREIPVFMRRFILSGRATDSSNEMISAEQYAELRLSLKSFLENTDGYVDGHYMKSGRISTQRVKFPFVRKECSAGHRGLVISPDGAVQACGFLGPLGETSIGKLPSQTLAQIWEDLNTSNRIQTLERNLDPYNQKTTGSKTNCLAIAYPQQKPLVEIDCIQQDVLS